MTSQPRCMNCDRQLVPGARFCQNCGTQVENPTEPLRTGAAGGVECPSCHHNNPSSSSFCEACGTQLSTAGTPPGGAPAAPAGADPWATGPAYERPLNVDATCPRCNSFRNPGDTVCTSCGLPFGERVNYDGVPPAVAMMGTPAGFWIRFVAVIVDGIILSIVNFGLAAAMGVKLISTDPDANADAPLALFQTITFVINLGYSVLFLTWKGATPGKMLFGIYVLDEQGRRGLNFFRALLRQVATYVSAFILLIGYIMVGFRRDKRALHDLIAGTYPTVVSRRN